MSEIKNARDYQLEIYEKAKKQNLIAWLPTGSGKTYISVLLINYYVQFLKLNNSRKNIIFLVNNTHLVIQQSQVIELNITGIKVGKYYGELNVVLVKK